jgi:hypothetical protein
MMLMAGLIRYLSSSMKWLLLVALVLIVSGAQAQTASPLPGNKGLAQSQSAEWRREKLCPALRASSGLRALWGDDYVRDPSCRVLR